VRFSVLCVQARQTKSFTLSWPITLHAYLLKLGCAVPEIAAYDSKIEGNVIFTRLDAAMNWMRKNSLWPMPMGLACCAIELMATAASRFDIARFGSEVMRFSPRQCDVMIVAGTVTYKMALAVKRIWLQMPEPKWCIAMGACASSGGMYRSYAVLQGIDQLIPVDVYVSGCPPRPEALLEGLIRLQKKIEEESSFLNQKPKLVHQLMPEGEGRTPPRPSIRGGVAGGTPSPGSLA
jgi:NADH-quinone oxidoreductase subunit B